jgi:hypothetical protein
MSFSTVSFRFGRAARFTLDCFWGVVAGPPVRRPDGADESVKAFDSGVATRQRGISPIHKRFYEKVMKVKADVAAVLNYFFPNSERNETQFS